MEISMHSLFEGAHERYGGGHRRAFTVRRHRGDWGMSTVIVGAVEEALTLCDTGGWRDLYGGGLRSGTPASSSRIQR